jgi:hypothetical protein
MESYTFAFYNYGPNNNVVNLWLFKYYVYFMYTHNVVIS